jgi:hypothetical protein
VLRWSEFERADVDVQIFMMQLLATLFVLPVSRRAFRIANMIMMETLWSQLIWLVDWWSGVQVIYSSLPYTEFPQSYDGSPFQSQISQNEVLTGQFIISQVRIYTDAETWQQMGIMFNS